MRELWSPPAPAASVWKASKHRLIGGDASPQYIEAAPDATWERVNPFDFYRPALQRTDPEKRAPHEHFSRLADMTLKILLTDEQAKLFRDSVRVLADLYGLLGLWREAFDSPLPPEDEGRLFVPVVPDTILDAGGRLRQIDPATEGKERLEKHLYERDRRIFQERGELHLLEQVILDPKHLMLPEELSFRRKDRRSMSSLFFRPPVMGEPPKPQTASYEDVQREYGVRVVFDRSAGLGGVSLIFTREPVDAWRRELRWFAQAPSLSGLNRNLEGVSPHIAADADGRPANTWLCPSLLKALYLMIYVDITSGARLQKCQAPGCGEYFRAGPRSRESLYCPPPPGRKQSKCASRASSRMYRERHQRNKTNTI